MAITSNTYTGNGSNKLFSITFPYIETTDVDVYLNGTLQTITTQYSFANATTIEFVTAPGAGVKVDLYRSTANDTNAATFFPGSSIRASDLNDNFDQALYTRQELLESTWNKTDDTLESVETWVSNDDFIATTAATANQMDVRHDTLVQTSTPGGSAWRLGKTWVQNDVNKTLSVWDGTTWLGIASGGTFTTQPSVIYVDSLNGNDTNDGHRIINPKKTIKNAVASANAGDIVRVVPGVYQEILPIDITVDNLSIVGDAQRSCFVHPTPATETQVMFRCNSGTYIDGFTFAGLKATGARGGNAIDSDATYGLPTSQGWVAGFYPGCVVRKSPYVNNCTNFADSGIDNSAFNPNNYSGTGGDLTSAPAGGGIIVDGALPSVSSPLRSFVVNEFTQVCLDGPGLLVCNNGYAQAVSFFGLFCHYHAKALSGGQINMEVGTTDFGRYGLIADGKSTAAIFTATANGAASASAVTFAINAPTAGGTWFGDANRPAINMLVQIGSDIYPILSSSVNGAGWNVTISRPNPSNRAQNLGLINSHSNGATVSFFLRSMISTASHTMEYAGSGTNYNALPENGGVADESKEAINLNNGKVWLTSTDQNGKFKVGDTFAVDQQTGFVTIDPNSYSTNLVSDLSPELGGDLDVLTRNIYSSLGNVQINDTLDVTGPILNSTGNVQINDPLDVRGSITLGAQNAASGTLQPTPGSGTNIAGSNLILRGGNPTGSGSGGEIQILPSPGSTVSGTTVRGNSQSGFYMKLSPTFWEDHPTLGLLTVALGSSMAQANRSGLAGDSTVLTIDGCDTASQTALEIVATNNGSQGDQGFIRFFGSSSKNPYATIVAKTPGTDYTSGNLAIRTYNAGVEGTVATFTNTGQLLVGTTNTTANGGVLQVSNGITFPATAVACTDANTLDDYEEGTWTPTWGTQINAPNGATGLTVVNANYVKVGTLVHVRATFTLVGASGTFAANTTIVIAGLPFTVVNRSGSTAFSSAGADYATWVGQTEGSTIRIAAATINGTASTTNIHVAATYVST